MIQQYYNQEQDDPMIPCWVCHGVGCGYCSGSGEMPLWDYERDADEDDDE